MGGLLTLMAAMVMLFAMAVPAFAALPTSGSAHFYAWGGATIGGSKAALTGMGQGNHLKVSTSNLPSSQTWIVKIASAGGYTISRDENRQNCVNIYRVAQSTSTPYCYYYATEYPYESSTNGRDQRVSYTKVNGKDAIYLYSPLVPTSGSVSGSWYLVTDATNPSTQSDVIWFGDASAAKGHWTA